MDWRSATGLLAIAAGTASLGGGVDGLRAEPGRWRFADGATAIQRQVALEESWADQGLLSLRARLSEPTLASVRLFAYLLTGDGLWYQSAHAVELERGRFKALELDLTPASAAWVPRGHMRPWDGYATQRVRAVGLKAFCEGDYDGSVVVEGVALHRDRSGGHGRLRLVDFEAPLEGRVGQCVEIRFRLTRHFRSPFDAHEVKVEGLVLPPSGQADYRLVPGFACQRYAPRWEGDGQRRRVPAGPLHWCIRFWPHEAGEFQCRILVRTRDAEARVPWSVRVAEPPAAAPDAPSAPARGASSAPEPWAPREGDFVVRRDYNGRDPLYIHRPGGWHADARTPDEGPILAWRVPLVWTERWGGYGGMGWVNLEVADRFDRLLDEAAAHGVALPLALTCDEPFGERAKFNWKDNPLNKANGGPLEAPSLFYTDPAAWNHFESVTRYVLGRWGGHPAVASWELWCTMAANGAEAWHARAGEHLATWRLGPKDVRSHHPQTMPPAAFATLNTFRREEMEARTRWMTHTVIRHTAERIRPVAHHGTDGDDALEVLARYPGEAAILRQVEADWHRYDRLAFDVFVPPDAPNDMRVMVFLRDGDLWWYETLLPDYLRPGDWTKLLVDLTGEVTRWAACGHAKDYNPYVLQRVRVLGLRVFGHRPYYGPLYVDNIQLWRRPDPGRQRLKVTHQRPNSLTVPQYGKFELTFRLSETFANPFDPDVADVVGHFTSPSGAQLAVPAFFHQDYERHLVDGREVLTPTGLPCWKLRFTPTEASADATESVYTYSVTVNGQRLPALSDQTFTAIPSERPGFVRRSAQDPRYFELTSGQFFYPIGMNLRSPSDNRKPYSVDYTLPEGLGTFIYDEYYRKLKDAGMNWARVWQCPWWCGLEWTRQWPGFQGLGRYNLENAWRFDYLLEAAARHGIYVQACLTNHGQITIERNIDRQWDSNPLRAALGEGGPLRRAADFYTHPDARRLFRNRMRYTVARWGYSPHLMAWSLFSEMEFTEAYWRDARGKDDNEGWARCPVVVRWVGEMAGHLKRIDPWHHLVTTHFSHPWRGRDVWSLDQLDLVQSNAYSAFGQLGGSGIDQAIDRYYGHYMDRYGRPVLIAEYGGHWMRNSSRKLDAELHAGIWASLTSPMAGITGFWWWLHVHYTDKYAHYRAAARYMAGEDRRGHRLRQTFPPVRSSRTPLRARALQDERVAYVWVYHPSVVHALDHIPLVEDARVEVRDLRPGRYRVEWWDTYKGERTDRRELTTDGTTLRIPLPIFRNDLALKVKPLD